MDSQSPSGVEPQHSALSLNKVDIVSDLSHELRTLLGGIIGINELLLTSEQTAHQKQLAQTIEQSSKTLLMVLTDISDLSRFEFSSISIENEPLDISKIAFEVIDQLNYLIQSREIEFQSEYDSLPPLVFADGGHLRHITSILLTHAFRSVSQGTVRLKMAGENQSAEGLDLHISVTAQPVADHDRTCLSTLSEPLKSGRKFDSRWLGLYLCVRLVELLKGSCGTDFEGSKCTLSVKLPLVKPRL